MLSDSDYRKETSTTTDSSGEESEATKRKKSSTPFQNKHVCKFEGCNQKFRRKTFLDRHVYKFHSKEKTHACTYDGCDKRYIISTHLKRHIQTSHEKHLAKPIVRIKCPIADCETYFNTNTNMRRHVRVFHEEAKTYSCKLCDYTSRHRTQYYRHIESHVRKIEPKAKTYTCDHCDDTFNQWSRLQRHCKEMHQPTCEFCNRTFVRKKNLNVHLKKHLKAGPDDQFTCSQDGCKRSYKHRRNLNAHIRTAHEGEKFRCPVPECGKNFTSKRRQQSHVELHKKSDIIVEMKEPAPRSDKGKIRISSTSILSGIPIKRKIDKMILADNAKDVKIVCSDFIPTSDSEGESICAPKNLRILISPAKS